MQYDHTALINDTSKTNCCGICPIEDLRKQANYYYGLAAQFKELAEETYSWYWIDAANRERKTAIQLDPDITEAEANTLMQELLS